MSRENNHINYSAGDIELYLAGKLSSMQMHAMEKAALDDPFLAEAMEGYEGMQGEEWNSQLVAIREEIAGKGAVAKVIPLHRSNNNWKKAIAAVLVLGAGSVLTFVLTRDKTVEQVNPQIAQTIPVVKGSDSVINTEPQPTVTASLNPTASASTEEIKANNGPVAMLPTKPKANQYTPEANATQIKPSAQDPSLVAINDDKTIVLAPPIINSNPATPASGDVRFAEETMEAKRKATAKQNTDADFLNRQQAGLANVRKEAAFNNFFTAQVVGADNSPLPFTNISIRKDNFGTYADAKGIVRLVSTDSILNVEVKSVGYVPKTFTLRNNQPQTKIILQEDEVSAKDLTIVRSGNASNQRSRRATLLSDSVINVEPADGWENYNTYVANNLDIPDDLLKKDLHGEVEISFDVKSNGTISNIRVNKSLGAEYDEAAKRLILEGPQWKVKKGRKTSAKVKVQF